MNKEYVNENLEENEMMTPLQKALFNYINNYTDVLYANKDNSKMDEIRALYCLHALNHTFK